MRDFLRHEWREWLPVVFLGVVLIYALAASLFITIRIAQVDQSLIAQQKADRQTLLNHQSLLKRVEADEARICSAAKTAVAEGGDPRLAAILCPKGS